MNLIFDFDGTIVDSFECVAKQMQRLAREFDFRELDMTEINKLRELSSSEVIEYFGIPFYKVPQIIYRIRKLLRAEIKNLPPISGLPEIFSTAHKAGFTLRILTSNSKQNVVTWLKVNNLESLFTQVHTENKFFSKSHRLKKLIRAYKMDKQSAFYIGDETRDIEAAKENNIRAVAVTWGYNSEAVLSKLNPHAIARKPQDILQICGLE